jgi:NAD(P) transhydrogenase subunit alpha
MKIAIPNEQLPGEMRVAATPDIVKKLIDLGFSVAVESGAGESASYADDAYHELGAEIVADAKAAWSVADVVLKVRAPGEYSDHDIDEVGIDATAG